MKVYALTVIFQFAALLLVAQQSVIPQVDSLIQAGDYTSASSLIRQALSSAGDDDQLRLRCRQAEVLILEGKLTEAEMMLTSRMPSSTTSPFVHAEWKTMRGFFYLNRARNDMALENLEQAQDLFRAAGKENTLEAARSLAILSFTYFTTGKLAQAEEHGAMALRIRRQSLGENSEEVAASYNDMGLIYGQTNPDKALEYYDMALSVYEKLHGKEHRKIAIANNNLGLVYRNQKLYGEAVTSFESAEAIWKKIYPDGHPNQAFALVNLGLTYGQMGNHAAAKGYFERALEMYRKAYGERHSDISAVLNQLGILAVEEKRYDGALRYYQEALAANTPSFAPKDLTDNPAIARHYNAKVLLYSLRLKAEALESKHLNKTLKRSDMTLALRCLQSCDTLIDNIRFNSSNESDKLEIGASANDVYESGVRIAQGVSEMTLRGREFNELAFYFAEKSKSAVLQESIADAEAKSFAGIPAELMETENQLKSSLALFNQQLSQKPDAATETALRQQLFETNRDYEAFVKRLESAYPDYFNLKFNRATPKVSDIQRQLKEGQVLVSYFIDEKNRRLYSFVITPSRFRVYPSSLPADFDKWIRAFTNGIFYMAPDVYASVAQPLSRILLRGIPKAKETIILPAGRLATMPFEALVIKKPEYTTSFENLTTGSTKRVSSFDDLRYLVQQTAISYEFSAGLMLQKKVKKISSANSIFLCAPIAFPPKDNLNDLPGSMDEVKAISALFGQDAYVATGKDANEALVKSGKLAAYRYLHFATHGIVDERSPELSRIYLQESVQEDGNVFSGEIFNLKLNADLAVLSACQTGLGKYSKGEGVIGLSRALVYAGAQSIIVSYWSVADQSTSELMAEFYRLLLQRPGISTQLALQRAKQKLVNGKTYASPYFWAPFVLIGQ